MPYSKSLKNQIQIMPEDLTDNVLLFLAGEMPCAIPLLKIATVIRMIEITPLSECQKQLEEMFTGQNGFTGIVGCITYHGELIPVYYLNGFFGKKIEMSALSDKLIIVNVGTDGNSMLTALWAKSIIGVYGRNDLFKIKEPEIRRENSDNDGIKAASEDKENLEEDKESIDSGIFGFKIYSSDLESLILVIEDIHEFLLHGRSGRFRNNFNFPINQNLKKKQQSNALSAFEYRSEICTDIEIKSAESEEIKKIKATLLERKKQTEQPYEEAGEGETIEILRFRLMYKEYAFMMEYIREVLIYDKLTPVPGTPDYIPGIFALRGEIISLVDLRKFFSLHCKGLTDLNLVIILTDGIITFGILADYITDIGTIPLHRLKAPDDDSTGINSKYIKGIVDDSLIVLDAEALLLDPDMIVDEK